MVHAFNFSQLQTELQKKGFLLVDFWAEWCGPCRALAPTFEEVSHQFKGKCTFAKVNVEESPEVQQFGISSIPCLILFKDGVESNRIVGALPADALKQQIEEMLK